MNKLINFIFVVTLFNSIPFYTEASEGQLKHAFNKGHFVIPDADELEKVKQVFQSELAGQETNELWKNLEMQRLVKTKWVYIQEVADKLLGRGFFVLREQNDAKPWLLQAPHAKSDLYTGRLAEKLFAEGEFKAAMWNTVPRNARVEKGLIDMTADMAHLSDTYWQAITESFARYFYGNAKIIQLHGFSQSKRKTRSGRRSDVILSAGHKYPPLWVREVAQCLKKSFPAKIKLYPYDIKELEAAANVQNRLLQNLGFNSFLHIELNKPIRKKLLKDSRLRQLLLSCIQ